jgi:hypothetical protein
MHLDIVVTIKLDEDQMKAIKELLLNIAKEASKPRKQKKTEPPQEEKASPP